MQILRTPFHSPLGQQAAQLRTDVFVHEQNVLPDEELDHLDATATHFVAIEDDHVIATLRIVSIISDNLPTAKIGRVAVAKNRRNAGIGKKLMLAAIAHAHEQGCHQCILGAQTHVISFYEKLGFIPHGPIFHEANIPHRHMTLILTPMRSGPYLITTFSQNTLPPICPICGQPANDIPQQFRINLNRSFILMGIVDILPYVFLIAFFCDRHYKIRRYANAFSIVFICATILFLAVIISARLSSFWTITAASFAAICALAAGILQVIATRGPHRYRIKPGYAILKNVHPSLLAQLPALPRNL